MNSRILSIIQHEKLTPSRFADIIGVQRSNVSHIYSGRSKPSVEFLSKILTSFPNISGDWLITGQGNMLKSGVTPRSNSLFDKPSIEPEKSKNEDQRELKAGEENAKVELGTSVKPNYAELDAKSQSKDGEPRLPVIEPILPVGNDLSLEIEQIVIFYKNKTFISYKPT